MDIIATHGKRCTTNNKENKVIIHKKTEEQRGGLPLGMTEERQMKETLKEKRGRKTLKW